jgi:hypothetical protein
VGKRFLRDVLYATIACAMPTAADHTFSQGASREGMMRVLSDELSAPPDRKMVALAG